MEYIVKKFPDFISYCNLAEVYERNLKPMKALDYYRIALINYENKHKNQSEYALMQEQVKRKIEQLRAPKNQDNR
jgi:ribosome-associated toxin RatA of RatAB toxin-antitoxin module